MFHRGVEHEWNGPEHGGTRFAEYFFHKVAGHIKDQAINGVSATNSLSNVGVRRKQDESGKSTNGLVYFYELRTLFVLYRIHPRGCDLLGR